MFLLRVEVSLKIEIGVLKIIFWHDLGSWNSTAACWELRSFWKWKLRVSLESLYFSGCRRDLKLDGSLLRFEIDPGIEISHPFGTMYVRSCLRDLRVNGSSLRFQVILGIDILGSCRAFIFWVCLRDLKLDGNLCVEVVLVIEIGVWSKLSSGRP